MGTYSQDAEDIKDSFQKWLQNASSGEGDISAEVIAKAWNKISKEEGWGDYLKSHDTWENKGEKE